VILTVRHRLAIFLSTFLFSSAGSYIAAQAVNEPRAGNLMDSRQWESSINTEHPLTGKIWHSGSQSFVDSETLLARISSSRYLLLGEKHDNPDHHYLQLEILQAIIARQQVGLVAFEMMESGQNTLLEGIQQQNFADLVALKEYLRWDEEGWEWEFYGPLIHEVWKAGIPLRGANINAEQMQQAYGQESDTWIAAVLNAEAVEQLNKEIDESHCNLLPASQFPSMVRVQQARDQQMASSLFAETGNIPEGKMRVLITGNYHIRKDISVPNYLLALDATVDPDRIISLAFLEVDSDSDDPLDYPQAFSDVNPYDFIWFTPVISQEDYCASLR
jgi:uncharacterized iron-regulated protein